MKKVMLMFALVIMTGTMFAQKFAYVDTEYILDNMPEYKEAQEKLNEVSDQWKAEIENDYKSIDEKYKRYQAEQVLLTDEMRRQREDEIMQMERNVKDKQKAKFGFEGELHNRREALIQPIQDRVYDAIQEMAKQRGLDFVFDKAGGAIMLFSNPQFDKSDDVLGLLGRR